MFLRGALLSIILIPGWARAGLWEEVAGSNRPPTAARTKDAGRDAERQLRGLLARSPGDFAARRRLAELLSATSRPREAAREFELAVTVAPTPADEARVWFRVANERSRIGALGQALDAYERQLALGDPDPAALANSAELLMAAGRATDAIDRYREAAIIEEREPNRRDHIQGIALSYFGLAVALDRTGHEIASREAIARALALDPGLATLRVATQAEGDGDGHGDVFFIPRGDVFYYLALAREAQGRRDDASAALRNYLRVANGPYTPRARERLARLITNGQANRPRSPLDTSAARLRVVHQATLQADGPLVSPLIDAAWRLDRALLDACLSSADPVAAASDSQQYKLSLELRIDETGRPTAVTVTAPDALGDALPRCIENAVLNRFRVSQPAKRKPTQVRMELVLAPAAPGGV